MFFASCACGVVQPASVATLPRSPFTGTFAQLCASPSLWSRVVGVGHPETSPVQTLADVRRPDARSAQIGGPDFIGQPFQVSSYSGEPIPSKRRRNLLSKHDWRTALGDEASKLGPEVPLVCDPLLFPRR